MQFGTEWQPQKKHLQLARADGAQLLEQITSVRERGRDAALARLQQLQYDEPALDQSLGEKRAALLEWEEYMNARTAGADSAMLKQCTAAAIAWLDGDDAAYAAAADGLEEDEAAQQFIQEFYGLEEARRAAQEAKSLLEWTRGEQAIQQSVADLWDFELQASLQDQRLSRQAAKSERRRRHALLKQNRIIAAQLTAKFRAARRQMEDPRLERYNNERVESAMEARLLEKLPQVGPSKRPQASTISKRAPRDGKGFL